MKNDARRHSFRNKKAFAEYFVVERFEAGLVLVGTEVKSIRAGHIAFKDTFAKFNGHELFLEGLYIAPYEMGNVFNHDPERDRKLLLNRQELRRLKTKVEEKGYTIVPLEVYFDSRGRVKVQIGLVRGKRLYDKRDDIKRRDEDREMQREFKDKWKGN